MPRRALTGELPRPTHDIVAAAAPLSACSQGRDRAALACLRRARHIALGLSITLVWPVASSAAQAVASAAAIWQEADRGLPLLRVFPPEAYRGHYQVNDIAVTPSGELFATSQQVVLRYDGARWSKVPFPTLWAWRICAADDGTVYVGGASELGRVVIGEDGEARYESLLPQVPKEAQPVGNVRGARAAGGAVAFAAETGWLVWKDGTMHFTPIPGTPRRTAVYAAHGDLFASGSGCDLLRWDGSVWQPVPLPPSDAPRTITALCAMRGDHVLACALDGTIFTGNADGTDFEITTAPAAQALVKYHAAGMLGLPDGTIAVHTTTAGLLLLAPDLSGFLHLDKRQGLPDNPTYGLAWDGAGGLWTGGIAGLTRVDLGAPVTVFDARNGPAPGSMRSFQRFAGKLYTGAVDGLHMLVPADPSTGEPAHFVPVPGLNRRVLDIATTPQGLLVANDDGLRLLDSDGGVHLAFEREGELSPVFTSVPDPGQIFLGTPRSLVVGRITDNRFVVQSELTQIGAINLITPTADGNVDIAGEDRRLWRVRPGPGGDWTAPVLEQLGDIEALNPGSSYVVAFDTPRGLRYHSQAGTWRFVEATQDSRAPSGSAATQGHFAADADFDGPKGRRYAFPSEIDMEGRLWASSGFASHPLAREVGWYDYPVPTAAMAAATKPTWHTAPACVQAQAGALGAFFFFRDTAERASEPMWAKSPVSVMRLETKRLTATPDGAAQQPARITAAISAGHRWTLRATGAAAAAGPRFPFSRERITFELAPASVAAGAGTTYEYRLLGYDAGWSAPQATPAVSFTALEGGPFTLEVRTVDEAGVRGAPARYTFSVAPPWHRTTTAYALYGLALVGLGVGAVRWRTKHLSRERDRLERIVATRTAELASARDAAESASRAKSAFLAQMSHELRTPLNAIIGYAQLLRRDTASGAPPRPEPTRNVIAERAAVIHQSGQHLLRLINDVLDFAKIEAGRMELHVAPVALPSLLHEVLAPHATAAQGKSLGFSIKLATDLPGWVQADAAKLRQVLDNLLGNAVKFTKSGSVSFNASCEAVPDPSHGSLPAPTGEPVTLVLEVVDTGPGLDAEERARLFRAFEQASAATTTRAPGTGLGLAIAQRLAALMRGRITIESTPGSGSTFTAKVPLRRAAPPAEPGLHAQGPLATAGYRGPRRRLLIVDDTPTNRSLLVELLAPHGFDCEEASDGAAALARLEQADLPSIHMLIVDLKMPGQYDGLEVARRARSAHRTSRLPIVLTSASVLGFDHEAAAQAGCDAFLPKPFEQEILLTILERLLGIEWVSAPTPAVSHPPTRAASSPPRAASEVVRALRDAAELGDLAAVRSLLAAARHGAPEDPLWQELESLAARFALAELRAKLATPGDG